MGWMDHDTGWTAGGPSPRTVSQVGDEDGFLLWRLEMGRSEHPKKRSGRAARRNDQHPKVRSESCYCKKWSPGNLTSRFKVSGNHPVRRAQQFAVAVAMPSEP